MADDGHSLPATDDEGTVSQLRTTPPTATGITRATAKAPARAARWSAGQLAGWLGGAAVLLALPLALEGLGRAYLLYVIALALIYGIVALGLNLLIGYAGQFSLGHAGFLAIGAYTSAILTQRYHWHPVLALPAAGLLTAAVGCLLGLPALRLSGPYLAVATLGFGVAVPQLVVWRGDLTGGTAGLRALPEAAIPVWWDPTTGWYNLFEFKSDKSYYYLALAFTALLTLVTANIVNSHTGRAFVAIRDSELAAQAMGVNLLRYKTVAFALSAGYAGIAGSLYAFLKPGIAPEEFNLFLSVEFLVMVVVGGLGTVRGGLIGAAFLTALPEIFARLPVLSRNENKNLYIVITGLLLILAILFLPRGLASLRLRGGERASGRAGTPPAH